MLDLSLCASMKSLPYLRRFSFCFPLYTSFHRCEVFEWRFFWRLAQASSNPPYVKWDSHGFTPSKNPLLTLRGSHDPTSTTGSIPYIRHNVKVDLSWTVCQWLSAPGIFKHETTTPLLQEVLWGFRWWNGYNMRSELPLSPLNKSHDPPSAKRSNSPYEGAIVVKNLLLFARQFLYLACTPSLDWTL